jgi:hypothetical protein
MTVRQSNFKVQVLHFFTFQVPLLCSCFNHVSLSWLSRKQRTRYDAANTMARLQNPVHHTTAVASPLTWHPWCELHPEAARAIALHPAFHALNPDTSN